MKKIIIILLFIACFFAVYSKEQNSKHPVKNVHPRLMFTESSLEQIKSGFLADENKSAYDYYKSITLNSCKKSEGFKKTKENHNWDGELWAKVEAAAFHAVAEDKENDRKLYASYAYSSFVKMCESANFENIYCAYRPYGLLVLLGAEIYDWCYQYLTQTEKNKIISCTEKMASKMEIGYPPVKQGAFTGHGAEAQLLRDLLAFAIAVFDEKPDVWNKVSNRFYQEYIEPRLFYYNSGLPSSQGCEYISYRSTFDIWAALLLTKAGLPDPYDGAISKWAHNFIYLWRPDQQPWRVGDEHLDSKENSKNAVKGYGYRFASNMILASAITKDPFAKAAAFEMSGDFKSFKFNTGEGSQDELISPTQFLIFNDTSLEKRSKTELDKICYFDYPCGQYIARTSWTEKDAAAVNMKMGQKFQSNHEHEDFGSFQIFAGQILASSSGAYESGSDYSGKPHTKSYYHSTIAHNCLLVEPKNPTVSDYGGQLPMPEAKTFENWNKDYERAVVLSHADEMKEDGSGYAFISGDLTKAYSHAKKVTRSMLTVFTGSTDTPILFCCYDYIIPKKDARAVFLLHTQSEPNINGKDITVYPKQMLENSYQLFSSAILPEQPEYNLIGGKGREFEIAGKNINSKYNVEKLQQGTSEIGWGRIELREKDSMGKSVVFLNAMTVSKDNKDSPTKLSTEHLDCAVYEIAGKSFVLGFVKNGYTIDKNTATKEIYDALGTNGDYNLYLCGVEKDNVIQ